MSKADDALLAYEKLADTVINLQRHIERTELDSHSLNNRIFNLEQRAPKATTQEIAVNIDGDTIIRLDQLLIIQAFLNKGQLIDAIKYFRSLRPNMSLKIAKDICEGIRAQMTFSIAKSFS